MSVQGLFTGIAVVIDDELPDPKSKISEITAAILREGGHVVPLTALPPADTRYVNYAGASFFILDWHLESSSVFVDPETGETIPMTPELQKQQLLDKVQFLLQLRQSRLAPVFIFTQENVEYVRQALEANEDLCPKGEPSHIFVMSKEEVIEKGVFSVLNQWVKDNPSALALKSWEQQYEKAKNDLFLDFYNKSVLWPAVLWKTFDKDGLPASDELGRLISRNLISRMVPFSIDMGSSMPKVEKISDEDPNRYRDILLRVLEGERFVRAIGLHDDSIAPGDIFRDGAEYWINIRPECDCVIRGGVEELALYLLKGKRLGPKDMREKLERPEAGQFTERDDEALVFAMYEGKSFRFKLKELEQKTWSEMKGKRIGRLLPPFLTRIQQRYSAYLQRPGLPKIPLEAMPADVIAKLKKPDADALTEVTAPAAAVNGAPSA